MWFNNHTLSNGSDMGNILLLSFSGFKVSVKSKKGNIPWIDSDQMKAARGVLKDMYDSYPEKHPALARNNKCRFAFANHLLFLVFIARPPCGRLKR
jgi:hypothetical protein